MRALVAVAATLALCACPVTVIPAPAKLSSFQVKVLGIYTRDAMNNRVPLAVNSACQLKFPMGVPDDAKGTFGCHYVIPRGFIEVDVKATGVDTKGERVATFNGPVSFKVVPGALAGDYSGRWAQATLGEVAATVRSQHQYGAVRVWVADAPVDPIFDGGIILNPEQLPAEPPQRTYASGASDTIYFDDQTLQSLQVPDGFDNKSSPFVGEFVTVGKNPESGETLNQTCADDARNNGQQALMVVTGIDPTGFYVADINACHLLERTVDPATGNTLVRTPEPQESCLVKLPDGREVAIETQTQINTGACQYSQRQCKKFADCLRFLPGTFGTMFVYNFNYPDGLNQGDLLFTVSGAVQEFTSTTQLVFPAWTIADHVRARPPSEWSIWLDRVKPVELNYRLCGDDNVLAPFITDVLCGNSSSNLKLESLESALVKLRGVTLPKTFVNCDFDGNGSLPCFSNRTERIQNVSVRSWGNCNFDPNPPPEPEGDVKERTCYQDCTLQRGDHGGAAVCSEESNFIGFGQYAVEMTPPGPAWANLDESLPLRTTTVPLPPTGTGGVMLPAQRSGGWVVDTTTGYETGANMVAVCDTDVTYRAGDETVNAEVTDAVLPARQVLKFRFEENHSAISFKPQRTAGTCWVAINPRARFNVVTKDAVPELNPDCHEDDTNAEKAKLCQQIHGATYDMVGHLRQIQAARPRWALIPRDPDDVCCYPGPGLSCPKPVKPCK